MDLIQEIRYNPKWMRLHKENPDVANMFINGIIRDYGWQMKAFDNYKAIIRQQLMSGLLKDNWKHTATMPEVYERWIKFLKPEDTPSNVWLNEFIRTRPELWTVPGAYGRRQQGGF
jgi:hypothetical protein